MKIKLVIYIGIIVIIILLAFNLFAFSMYNEINKGLQYDRIGSIVKQNNDRVYETIYSDIFAMLEMENKKLDEELTLKDEMNNSYRIKDIITHQTLVMKYSYINCQTCVDSVLSCLMKHIQEIGEENVILLATYHNREDFFTFKRINQIKVPVYNVESIDLPMEETGLPYFFTVNKDLSINYSFIPHKEILKETDDYLQFISRTLSENND